MQNHLVSQQGHHSSGFRKMNGIQNEQRSFKYETFPDSQLCQSEKTTTAVLHNNPHVSEPEDRNYF